MKATKEQTEEYLKAKEKSEHLETIEKMSHIEMARLYRFAPSGHPYFNTELPYVKFFMKRFNELGGMTPEISKLIGW